MDLDLLAKLFRAIGEESKDAYEQTNPTRFHILVKLVIALERAYPEQMQALREEEVIE